MPAFHTHDDLAPLDELDDLDRLARKRAGAKMGWLLHACVYLCVNLALAALAAYQGRHWAVFPALGWGLGLAIHGAAVWLALPGGRLHARLLERERAALRQALQRR
ncbi:2TM domain-containing protein [Acidovorax sp. SUPP2539]|uniref:2TM domain-containing protein n=1 Tax=Acidovorax sp. SUPP2539 TaxID=2920878 RepID=UPI0023DE61F5|nr:2TM domain-containing protein [Acidovorax sp. SUPP2539]GKS88599.1 2TM domain-containing protein [Acidovorax sp. SUPP2539]